MSKIGLNLKNIKSSYFPLEEGWYEATVIDSEVSESQAGNPIIIWKWQLANGRRLRDYMVTNSERGLKQLKKMAESCGHPNPDYVEDTDELHGLSCLVKVTIKDERNWIDGYRALEPSAAAKGSNFVGTAF